MSKQDRERARTPVRLNHQASVIVVTCNELEQVPAWIIRKYLGTFMIVRTPGAVLDAADSNAASLEHIIVNNPDIRHVVLCLHSLCTQFHVESPLFKQDVSTKTDLKKAMLQQVWLSKTIPNLKSWFNKLGRDEIELHGWIYEPETDWVSALDTETGLFLPLNAHTRFYNEELVNE